MFDFDKHLADLTGQTVLCVGDLMLDEFVYGEVSRISPEAPTPVIAVKRTEMMIGGVAANLAEHCIKKVETVEYPELGMEAIWRIEVVDFPAFIVVDDKGNDFFKELNLG